ncbi:MAG: guanylate kinase [Clostridia bacterium]|nr:guanylate kinase [Clostridia bacterium]
MTPSDTLPGILLVVSGAAGTGKSTVNSSLVSRYPEKYAFSVSATTRKPRPCETDGTDYHFVSREEFEKKIESGEMLEYTEYCGNYYGTPLSELSKLDEGKTLILEIETEGAQNVKRVRPDAVTVFIIPPDYETLKNRLVGRGTNTPEDIRNRLNKAIHEIRLAAKYDYAVVNRDGGIDEAVSAIDGIVESEKRRTSRLPSGTLEKMFPEISGETDE